MAKSHLNPQIMEIFDGTGLKDPKVGKGSDSIRTGLCPPVVLVLDNGAPISWAGSIMSMYDEAIDLTVYDHASWK